MTTDQCALFNLSKQKYNFLNIVKSIKATNPGTDSERKEAHHSKTGPNTPPSQQPDNPSIGTHYTVQFIHNWVYNLSPPCLGQGCGSGSAWIRIHFPFSWIWIQEEKNRKITPEKMKGNL